MNFNKATPKGPSGTITDTWLTPLSLIEQLGTFDLDPCAYPTHPTATTLYCLQNAQDGLTEPWKGRIWLNPPYSDVSPWLERLAAHGNGIALVYARTDTQWFQMAAPKCDAINFMSGRVKFLKSSGEVGNSPAPSILMAYGEANVASIEAVRGCVMKRHTSWNLDRIQIERDYAKEPRVEGEWRFWDKL